jgi:DNA-binding Lrp family transcriptional regulator
LDELDVKIFRALIHESAVAPSNPQVNSSLRSIATRVGADDMTVNRRYKKLQESGSMSAWWLLVNPTFFGWKMVEVTVDVQPESEKSDMIRKLKLVHEIAQIINFYGRAMKMMLIYKNEESRSRTIELISRITNTETMTQTHWRLPQSRTEHLTETDLAIIGALSRAARKNYAQVARELGVSLRTVRSRVGRLRMENTVFAIPNLNMGGIPGLIPVYLSFSYMNHESKETVDRAMRSHFEASYFSGAFTDRENGYIVLSASTMQDVQESLEWAKSLPGVASARVDILIKTLIFPEKLVELLQNKNEKSDSQRRALFQ